MLDECTIKNIINSITVESMIIQDNSIPNLEKTIILKQNYDSSCNLQ